jgi:hypothetical protein
VRRSHRRLRQCGRTGRDRDTASRRLCRSPTDHTYETYSYRSGPRVYYGAPRYRYRDIDDDDVVIVRPRYRGGCGAHAYWDGGRCVYFRY